LLRSQLGPYFNEVRVVVVSGQPFFNKSAAQNLGALHSHHRVFFFCDCDVICDPTDIVTLAAELIKKPGTFGTFFGVRESEINARKAKHLASFGYELRLKTADGRQVHIMDNEEDSQTGTRQAPGLLFVHRSDFLAVQGYNSQLHGWGWEDQDMICRLTLGGGLKRLLRGRAIHVSHGDKARIAAYPQVSSRWESRDVMFRKALSNYDSGQFLGTYDYDRNRIHSLVTTVSKAFGTVRPPQDQQHFPAEQRPDRERPRGGSPTVSACLIVRDEEQVLARCLDSIAGLYDQLVIIDTGSTDGTPSIAARYRADFTRFTGCNSPDGLIMDFAAARNVALASAKCDWILQIDADEILTSGADAIRRHINESRYDHIAFSILSDGVQWSSGRLFRRSACVGYRSRVHEYMDCKGAFFADPRVVIENIMSKKGKERSADRNIRLCTLMIEEDPQNGRTYHYLGNEYRLLRRLDEAIECYRRAIELGNFKVGLFHSAYYLAICYLLREDFESAIAAGLQAVKIDPRYAEGHCVLGDAYTCYGHIAFARQWYLNALQCHAPPADAVLPVQAWAYHYHPIKRLRDIDSNRRDF
jgi:glycosyltransferase involved in cell wall biosynthesis